jgi:hypothetical protein
VTFFCVSIGQAVFFTQHYVLYPTPLSSSTRFPVADGDEENGVGGDSQYDKPPLIQHRPSDRFEVVCLLDAAPDDLDTYCTADDVVDDHDDDDGETL